MLSRVPPLVALLRFLNVREKEKGLKPPLHDPTCNASFSIYRHYFSNPNGEDVWKWISNLISKFYDNSTVNESGIIVLPRQILGFCRKRKGYDVKCISLRFDWLSKFLTVKSLGIEFLTGYLNFTTIYQWMSPRSSFFWYRFGGRQEKRGFWEKEKEKRNWEEKKVEKLSSV